MEATTTHYDVIVAGAGPAGATAALVLARAGIRVLIIEKAPFPRFQIGESFMPATLALMQRLGLEERLRQLPHTVKIGAEFGMGGVLNTTLVRFSTRLAGTLAETFNIARADFDQMMLDAALDAGAEIKMPLTVRSIEKLADEDVALVADDGRRFTARYLVDASGHGTLVGRHLGTRRVLEDQHLQKAAYFNHFENVQRLEGELEGHPTIAVCEEGWFWIIPLNDKVTSVGLVMDPKAAKTVGSPADQMLRWGIDRCPLVASRMKNAVGPRTNLVRADFSYRCDPFAGPGHFLVGDAAMFLDPVFSTGVCAGMTGGSQAADRLIEILQHKRSPDAARKEYLRYMKSGMSWFRRMVELYYKHGFREMLLNGTGPLHVHTAFLSLLAGHVFPKPTFAVRWRIAFFELLMQIHRVVRLVPKRERFSLFASPAPAGSQTPHAIVAH